MSQQDIFIIEPATLEETNALKAFAKALKLKFQISKKPLSNGKNEILTNIQQGIKEVRLMEQGNLTTISAKEFLDEL